MVDVSRRMFCFGAAATLIVPKPKSFFIIEPPKLIVQPYRPPFDLPMQQMLSLLKKLEDQMIEVSAVPRWAVVDHEWYDTVVGSSPAGRREALSRARLAASNQPGDRTSRIPLRA